MAPRKANQPQLTTDQIVTAALELIDETGLDGHNMRALAQRLGVDASTIYYHLPNRAALFTSIVDRVMAAVDFSRDDPQLPLQQRLVAAANEYRRVLMLHPRALPLLTAHSLRTPTQLRSVEVLLGILFDGGFTATEALIALDAIGETVIGMSAIHAAHAERTSPEEPFLAEPAEQFGNVRRLLAEGRYVGFEAEFDAAIHALIDGLLSRQAAGTLLPVGAPEIGLASASIQKDDHAQDTH